MGGCIREHLHECLPRDGAIEGLSAAGREERAANAQPGVVEDVDADDEGTRAR